MLHNSAILTLGLLALPACFAACTDDSKSSASDGGSGSDAASLDAASRDAAIAHDAGGSPPDGSLSVADAAADAGADAGHLLWYATCGEPVCHTQAAGDAGVPACDAGQRAALTCDDRGSQCDPGLGCGVLLRCTDTDPTMGIGGCPISRASAKVDIEYLAGPALQHYHDRVIGLGLAHYRYRNDPSRQERLGFIIEDVEPSRFVDEARDRVDLYAYTSALVAALKIQEQRIRELERKVAAMRRRPRRN